MIEEVKWVLENDKKFFKELLDEHATLMGRIRVLETSDFEQEEEEEDGA
jgi:hypothetical protein